MEFYGHIQDGHLALPEPQMRLRAQWLSSMPNGAAVRERLERVHKPGTYRQLKTHFGLLVKMILLELQGRGWDLGTLIPNAGIPDGVPVTKDIIQQVLYAACNAVGDNGERKTLSRMSSIERSRFFENCRNHAAQYWQIVVPDPDPNWQERKKKT